MWLIRPVELSTLLVVTASLLLPGLARAAEPELQEAPLNPVFLQQLAEREAAGPARESFGGFVPGDFPGPIDRSYLTGMSIGSSKFPREGAPATYDLRTQSKVTAVRNQGACGSCWAFGAIASGESFLLTGETTDWSENNMKNTHGFEWGHCDGGNADMAAAYLVRWDGVIWESEDPYSASNPTSPSPVTVQKHVQNVYYLPDRTSSTANDILKNAVMDFGAVRTSMRWEGATSSSSEYYNPTNDAYYFASCNGVDQWCIDRFGASFYCHTDYDLCTDGSSAKSTNHAVGIVGWDDNYAASNFATTAPGPGAFLIRNSWGSTWGNDGGYFWISYYDRFVTNNTVYTSESASNYDAVYQLDPFGQTNAIGYSSGSDGYGWFANIFTATDDHVLEAVGFFAAVPSTAYQIRIYIGVDSGDPDSGTLVHSQSGTLTYAGFNTVVLNNSSYNIVVEDTTLFSVAVRLDTPDYTYAIPLEQYYSGYAHTTQERYESFYGADGSTWYDLNAPSNNWESNAVLKAYGDIKPLYAMVGEVRGYVHPRGVQLEWQTAAENGTVGFHVQRQDSESGRFRKVSRRLLPAQLRTAGGGQYRFLDRGAPTDGPLFYRLVEVDRRGRRSLHGPYEVMPADPGRSDALLEDHGNGKPTFRREARRGRYRRRAESRGHGRHHRRGHRGERLKIAVNEEGLYFVDALSVATGLGLRYQRARALIAAGKLGLTSNGQPVAQLAAKGGRGLYFYGTGLDTPFTDEQVFWLSRGRALKMEQRRAAPRRVEPDPSASFPFTQVVEQDRMPVTALFDDPDGDYWLWQHLVAGFSSLDSAEFALPVAHRDPDADTATLLVRLQGGSDGEGGPDHRLDLALNGEPIGEAQFNGTEPYLAAYQFDAALLQEGDNTLSVLSRTSPGVSFSVSYVDGFELEYARRFHAEDDRLRFTAAGHAAVEIDGFDSAQVRALDISDPRRPVLLTGGRIARTDSGYAIALRPGGAGPLLAALPQAPLRVEPAAGTARALLRGPGARYLVIAPEALAEPAERLAEYRLGQGLSSRVVSLEAIYDTFNHGVPHPEAIRVFLTHAHRRWRVPPELVVLAGDGSMDCRDRLGHGECLVPPLMVPTSDGLFAADGRYGDINGDGVPEIAIGRLPVASAEALDALVQRIVEYEGAPGDGWQQRAILLADDPDGGGDFTAASIAAAEHLPSYLDTQALHLSELGLEATRTELLAALDEGALLVHYVGHAGVDRLAQEGLLTVADPDTLSNGARRPLMLAMTCMAGRFTVPGFESLGEAMLLGEAGGAIGVYAPTGLSRGADDRALGQALLDALFDASHPTVGQAILAAHAAYLATGRTAGLPALYNYLGDPALSLAGRD